MQPAFDIGGKSRIYIGSAAELLPGLLPDARIVAVTDPEVARAVRPLLDRFETFLIERGEEHKNLDTVGSLYRRFIAAGVDRATFVLAVGGGIVTDTAGFAASTYMRGVRFGFVSTTLLGQVDASVGGKNGVNVDGYKNMAGCFSQPRFVVCDPALTATLPEREFRAGLAEMVKAALIADGALFARLEEASFARLRSDFGLLGQTVEAAVRVKAGIVERDEREAGERRKLNLGHTLAHAIEKCSPVMNHGEAVAVGVAMMARVSVGLGLLCEAECRRITALLRRWGFATEPPVPVGQLLDAVTRDKKSEAGRLHIVLPAGIGRCELRTLSHADFAALVQGC